jgi:hypothetical protein
MLFDGGSGDFVPGGAETETPESSPEAKAPVASTNPIISEYISWDQLIQLHGQPQYYTDIRQAHLSSRNEQLKWCDNTFYYLRSETRLCSVCGNIFTAEQDREAGLTSPEAHIRFEAPAWEDCTFDINSITLEQWRKLRWMPNLWFTDVMKMFGVGELRAHQIMTYMTETWLWPGSEDDYDKIVHGISDALRDGNVSFLDEHLIDPQNTGWYVSKYAELFDEVQSRWVDLGNGERGLRPGEDTLMVSYRPMDGGGALKIAIELKIGPMIQPGDYIPDVNWTHIYTPPN